MSDTPQVLLAHHLKALRLPTFLREYDKLARQCAAEGVDRSRYLLRLAELEMIRAGTANRRATDQGGQVPGGEKSRQLRLHRDPARESAVGTASTFVPSSSPTTSLSGCKYRRG